MDIPTNYLEKKIKIPKKRGINSFTHEIAKQVCDYIDEPDRFKQWLGITARIGTGKMLDLLKQMEKKNIKSAAYLMACTKKWKSSKQLNAPVKNGKYLTKTS